MIFLIPTLGWSWRAEKNSHGGHRQAQPGNQRRPGGSQDEGAVRRTGRRGGRRLVDDVAKLVSDETEKWGKVIRAANIKME
jgi:hypothetical protein